MSRLIKIIALMLLLALAVAVGWKVLQQPVEKTKKRKSSGDQAVPVEVGYVQQASLELIRRYTGSLKANSEFLVAPKISGRIKTIHVDLADRVEQGMLVVEIDQDEARSRVLQSEAEVEVARAGHAEAKNLREISTRELKRIERLGKTGVTTESQRDAANADFLAKSALVSVTRAKLTQAEAALQTALIQLQETQIRAQWQSGNQYRLVAERFVDEGETVSANSPLLRIVELDPLKAVFAVTETDYGRLSVGQKVRLGTDAFPGETFPASIQRIAPVFDENTRQAMVEVAVTNPEQKLKPGMFVRADVVLQQVENVQAVPESAVVRRQQQDGVFLLNDNGEAVNWLPVESGIAQKGLLQVTAEGLQGRVVTLGQHMLDDGSRINVVREAEKP